MVMLQGVLGMSPGQEVVLGSFLFTAIGVLVNLWICQFKDKMETAHPGGWHHPLYETVHFGHSHSPVYGFLISICNVIFIYTVTLTAAWKTYGGGLMDWLDATDEIGLFPPADRPDMASYLFLCRIFMYAFLGYLFRDFHTMWFLKGSANFFTKSNFASLFMVHHIACSAGILICLYSTQRCGVTSALGMYSLELGSVLFNMWIVDFTFRSPAGAELAPWWPSKATVYWLYATLFNFSNALGLYLCLRAAWTVYLDGHFITSGFYAIAGGAICLLRERDMLKNVTDGKRQPKLLRQS